MSSKYRACPATSSEGQAATASALVRAPWITCLPEGWRAIQSCRGWAWFAAARQRWFVGAQPGPLSWPINPTPDTCRPARFPPPQVGMLVAMGANGALLVKLADRLHDMRTLGALPAAKRNRLARETIDVWAPLANRLGVWSLKAQLEDLAFKQLFPAQVCGWRLSLCSVGGCRCGAWVLKPAGVAIAEPASPPTPLLPCSHSLQRSPCNLPALYSLPAVCGAARPPGTSAVGGRAGLVVRQAAGGDAAAGHQVRLGWAAEGTSHCCRRLGPLGSNAPAPPCPAPQLPRFVGPPQAPVGRVQEDDLQEVSCRSAALLAAPLPCLRCAHSAWRADRCWLLVLLGWSTTLPASCPTPLT